MSNIHLRGMTWDHPRGFDPLVACSKLYREQTGVSIKWDRRSLQDFESYPVDELASRYDLIIIDHPHVGEVVRQGCLVPLSHDERPATELPELLAGSVGLSYHSYLYAGRLWALPIDAATQVQAWRPDRLEQSTIRWSQVLELARDGQVLLPLRSPHALMCVMTLAANLGWAVDASRDAFLPRDIGLHAIDQLAQVTRHIDPQCWDEDPIAALDRLAGSDRLTLCPLVYGYVSYSLEGFRPHRLAFGNIPCLGNSGPIGSVLGGTGLAISARCDAPKAATAFAYWVTSAVMQRGLYAQAGGQPGHGVAWIDPEVNGRSLDFFAATRATLEGAMLRPRHAGYLVFQDRAARMVARHLAAGSSAHDILEEVNDLYRASLI
jgi:multiple sugar transport system substrate-binding protein